MALGYYNNEKTFPAGVQWSLRVTTAPAAEPVSVTEAKTHLRVDGSDDDTYIGTLITASREYCEAFTGRAFINQTLCMYISQFPNTRILELPRPNLSSISHVKYYDLDDVLQTYSSTNYRADTTALVGRVMLKDDSAWPDVIDDRGDAVQITYVAGYGAAGTNVPGAIKQAMLLLIGHWYRVRESVAFGITTKEIEFTTENILAGYKVPIF